MVGDRPPKPRNWEFSGLAHRLLDPYYKFERNVLPLSLIPRMARGWIDGGEFRRLGLAMPPEGFDYFDDDYYFPKYELH
jgi:hypothetical protein